MNRDRIGCLISLFGGLCLVAGVFVMFYAWWF